MKIFNEKDRQDIKKPENMPENSENSENAESSKDLEAQKDKNKKASKGDFGNGNIVLTIMRLAIPLTMAQLINVLYNVVDRIYIGRMAEASVESLTGIGLAVPFITIVMAFANLFGIGGSTLFSIARGAKDEQKARKILSNVFTMLMLTGLVLSISIYSFQRPLLFMFGASNRTYSYASAYISIYVLGTIFVMLSLGLNYFINAQGFGVTGMLTVSIGAVLNIVLDPIFIFLFNMGIRGAALATIISQFVSAIWVLLFLTGNKAIIKLSKSNMLPDFKLIGQIILIGIPGFIMSVTNATVQVVCNMTLYKWGGDIYVSVMTLINSMREVVSMPVIATCDATKPILSFNYGAKKYSRVKSAITFMSVFCLTISFIIWMLVFKYPEAFIKIFSSDAEILKYGVPSLHAYFFGFFLMTFQFAGQSVFQSLGMAKRAIFFSIFRKVIIVVPLTILLPYLFGLGTTGVFIAEPISNLIGGGASFITMIMTVWTKLPKDGE